MLPRVRNELIKHVTCQLKNFNYHSRRARSTEEFNNEICCQREHEFSAQKVFQSMSLVAATRRRSCCRWQNATSSWQITTAKCWNNIIDILLFLAGVFLSFQFHQTLHNLRIRIVYSWLVAVVRQHEARQPLQRIFWLDFHHLVESIGQWLINCWAEIIVVPVGAADWLQHH